MAGPRAFVPAQSGLPVDAFPGLNNRPDANSATVLHGTGPVLNHVQVYLIFWGSAWQNAAPSADTVAYAVTCILYGPYMSGLAQYNGIGGGRLVGQQVITSSEPPAPFSDGQVRDFVNGHLNANVLPQPVTNNQYFFCVIMPSGLLGSDPSAIGEHNSFLWNRLWVPYMWVMNDGTLFAGQRPDRRAVVRPQRLCH
jgi:hypothetical protein